MKLKNRLSFLLLFAAVSCKKNDDSILKESPTPSNKSSMSTHRVSTQSVDIEFKLGYDFKSGCTDQDLDYNDKWYTNTSVYGPNPAIYAVRGYGKPKHITAFFTLALFASNKAVARTNPRTGAAYTAQEPRGSAISIEYPFKANVTYEIAVKTLFRDNISVFQSPKRSNGFPTLYAELRTTPEMSGTYQDPCLGLGVVGIQGSYPNPHMYTKSQTLANNIQEYKTFVFKFSPLEERKALKITLNPKEADSRGAVNLQVPESSYTMLLPLISITEKPFDPSINDISVPPTRDRNYPPTRN